MYSFPFPKTIFVNNISLRISNYILKLNSTNKLAGSISLSPPHTRLFRNGADFDGPRINVVKFYSIAAIILQSPRRRNRFRCKKKNDRSQRRNTMKHRRKLFTIGRDLFVSRCMYTCTRAGLFPAGKSERNAQRIERTQSFLKTFVSIFYTRNCKNLWLHIVFTILSVSIDFNGIRPSASIITLLPHYERLCVRRAGDFWFKHVEKFISDPPPLRWFSQKDTYFSWKVTSNAARFKEILLFALTHITGF